MTAGQDLNNQILWVRGRVVYVRIFGTIAFWLILFMAKLKMTLLTPTLLLLYLGIGVHAGYYPSWLIKIAPVNRASVVFYADSLAQQNGLVNVGQVSKVGNHILSRN